MTRRTRHLSAVAATVLVAALAFAACGESDEPLQVSNDVYSIEIPAGYEELGGSAQDATEDAVDDKLTEELGGEVAFELNNAWAKDREDGFATNINVAAEQLPPGLSFEEYRRITLENADSLGFEIEGEGEPATLGGEAALLFDGTQSPQDVTLKSRIIAAIHGNVAYSLTLTTLEDRFDDEVGAFEESRETWTWTD